MLMGFRWLRRGAWSLREGSRRRLPCSVRWQWRCAAGRFRYVRILRGEKKDGLVEQHGESDLQSAKRILGVVRRIQREEVRGVLDHWYRLLCCGLQPFIEIHLHSP